MAIAHVQGNSAWQAGPGNNSVSVTLTGVTAGNCLIVSVGFFNFLALGKGGPLISDTAGNVWLMACTSPVASNTGGLAWEIYTFVAQDCVAGSTTITFLLGNDGGGPLNITVDEYSGVSTIQAIDTVSFNSTAYASGLTTVSSGSITAASGELIYSAAFAGLDSATLTPSGGFNSRQLVNTHLSLASFDLISSGGSISNTITCGGGSPDSLQVILLSLSPTPITRRIVQWAMSANSSIMTELTTAVYPYPNTAGNLLVAFGQFYERISPVITDTQGNAWTLVYGNDPPGPTGTFAVAYCTSCKGGPNSVELNTLGGGDDNSLSLLIAEYAIPGTVFLASSYGNTSGMSVATVNTGSVGVSNPPAILISGLFADDNGTHLAYPPAANLGIRRFQYSESGFLSGTGRSLAIADQTEMSAGSYANVFDVTPDTGPMEAAILGFTLPPIFLTCASGTGQLGVPYTSGVTASGGIPPYVFSIIAGGLPPGLTFNTVTGAITGIPTTPGIYPYTAQVTDSLDNVATASCVITIGTRGSCGVMPTLEITRDLDADWGDSSTFFITQDQPFPFTLRGIVLRMSYDLD